jgi:transmembrane sensor
MDDIKVKVIALLQKTQLSSDERRWLLNYIENSDTKELRELLKMKFDSKHWFFVKKNHPEANEILQSIHQKLNFQEKQAVSPILLWRPKLAMAASIIGFALVGTYFLLKYTTKRSSETDNYTATSLANILPGKNIAYLTLGNGATILLDNSKNGSIARQGKSRIIKTNNKVAYQTVESGEGSVVFNSLSTPRGAQYQVELPDGTHVWLNAASTLRYPTSFTGKFRVVEVTGEAYFEVAKNKEKPFIVKVDSAEIRVLGTHFNVMAYVDEQSVKTSLFEGSVKFTRYNQTSLLKPGEQSQLSKTGKLSVVNNIDINNEIAWKNGLFHFENADIETVMRQLSRWYNIDVDFKGKKTDDLFFVEMPESSNLADVLKVLEITGHIKFEMEGRRLTIMP